jgi:hypothetical protein
MKNTSPLWLWAGVANANAPTGSSTEAVVIEVDGTIRAAAVSEPQGEAVVAIIVSEEDLALIPGEREAVRRLFLWQGQTIEGWACSLEDLKAVVVAHVVVKRDARRLARCVAHRDRLDALIATPEPAGTGDFLSGLMQNTQKRFLAGEEDPAAVLARLNMEIEGIRSAALARGGEAALAELEQAVSKVNRRENAGGGLGVGDDGFDDFVDEDEGDERDY